MKGELKDVLIRFVVNICIDQTIDTIATDIHKSYGLLLSRDWSWNINGYFATGWSHLWLPWNGRVNQIGIDSEKYRKHTLTSFNSPSDPSKNDAPILGNYTLKYFFG